MFLSFRLLLCCFFFFLFSFFFFFVACRTRSQATHRRADQPIRRSTTILARRECQRARREPRGRVQRAAHTGETPQRGRRPDTGAAARRHHAVADARRFARAANRNAGRLCGAALDRFELHAVQPLASHAVNRMLFFIAQGLERLEQSSWLRMSPRTKNLLWSVYL